METLTWTGTLSGLNVAFYAVVAALALAIVARLLFTVFGPAAGRPGVNADGTLTGPVGVAGVLSMAVRYSFFALATLVLAAYSSDCI